MICLRSWILENLLFVGILWTRIHAPWVQSYIAYIRHVFQSSVISSLHDEDKYINIS